MTRDDIYDHLAQVYLGKRKKTDEKKKKQFNAWLVINAFITVVIFASAFYGLTAFLTHRSTDFKDKIIYELHSGVIRMDYDFVGSLAPEKSFVLSIPPLDASKYKMIRFSVRAKEEGNPGVVKVILRNRRNEQSYFYIQGVNQEWQEYAIPLDEFQQITDWTELNDLAFVLETWNVESKKGVVLIEDVQFAGIN